MAFFFNRRGFCHNAQIEQRSYHCTCTLLLHASHNLTSNSSFLEPLSQNTSLLTAILQELHFYGEMEK